MEKTFYMNGVEYLEWTSNGCVFKAVKEQVEFFGKEVFEQVLDDFCEENDLAQPDGITYDPDWWLDDVEIQSDREAFYKWCREQEIM